MSTTGNPSDRDPRAAPGSAIKAGGIPPRAPPRSLRRSVCGSQAGSDQDAACSREFDPLAAFLLSPWFERGQTAMQPDDDAWRIPGNGRAARATAFSRLPNPPSSGAPARPVTGSGPPGPPDPFVCLTDAVRVTSNPISRLRKQQLGGHDSLALRQPGDNRSGVPTRGIEAQAAPGTTQSRSSGDFDWPRRRACPRARRQLLTSPVRTRRRCRLPRRPWRKRTGAPRMSGRKSMGGGAGRSPRRGAPGSPDVEGGGETLEQDDSAPPISLPEPPTPSSRRLPVAELPTLDLPPPLRPPSPPPPAATGRCRSRPSAADPACARRIHGVLRSPGRVHQPHCYGAGSTRARSRAPSAASAARTFPSTSATSASMAHKPRRSAEVSCDMCGG